jgi:hypothetical protein
MKLLLKGGPLGGQTLYVRGDFQSSLPLEHPAANEVGHYSDTGLWIVERALTSQVEMTL